MCSGKIYPLVLGRRAKLPHLFRSIQLKKEGRKTSYGYEPVSLASSPVNLLLLRILLWSDHNQEHAPILRPLVHSLQPKSGIKNRVQALSLTLAISATFSAAA